MPRHRPIKFEPLNPTTTKEIIKIISKNETAKSIANAAFSIAALGGVLTLAVVAPNALGLVARILNKNKKAKKERYRKLWQEFNLMKKRREIDFIKEENGVCVYRLNDKGKSKIKKFILDELLVAVPGKWDKKWRLVVFDIPERWRKERRAFRLKLQEMGFYQCQKSVWIHPFPCIEEIEFLKDIFKIKPFVKLFIVDEMSDGKVLYHFKEMIKSKL